MDFNSFIQSLKNVLQNNPLPGQDAQYIMAAENIRNKKIDLDSLKEYKKSAVCLLLYEKNKEPYFVLIKRPDTHRHHAGQIALPGGSCEPTESYEQTALRELYEETGISITEKNILGNLTPLYIPVSNFYIQPVVAYLENEPNFKSDPIEVVHLIEQSFFEITNGDIVSETMVNLTRGMKIKAPYFNIQGEVLWGATAMLLSEMKEIVKQPIFSSLSR
jgi:8-oxo-dGTP pyrophosphatase MutT (NUDIX family)